MDIGIYFEIYPGNNIYVLFLTWPPISYESIKEIQKQILSNLYAMIRCRGWVFLQNWKYKILNPTMHKIIISKLLLKCSSPKRIYFSLWKKIFAWIWSHKGVAWEMRGLKYLTAWESCGFKCVTAWESFGLKYMTEWKRCCSKYDCLRYVRFKQAFK